MFSLLLLCLLDLGFGLLYEKITPVQGQLAVKLMLHEDESVKSGYVVQHPYMLYVNRPGWTVGGYRQFNSKGLRGKEITQEPAEGVIRVLAMGGPTALGYPFVINSDDAWPSQLEVILEQETGRKVEVLNAGLNSGASPELLTHYLFRHRYLKPHIVILHTGGNDAEAICFPGYDPEYTHSTSGWKESALALRPNERKLLKSGIVRTVYAWWLSNVSLNTTIGRRVVFEELTPQESLANAKKQDPIGFRRNLDLLVKTINDDGAIPVLFPFVSAPRDVMEQTKDPYGAYYECLYEGYRKDRDVMFDLSKKYEVPFSEMADGAIPGEYFFDNCHLNPRGEAIKARFMADQLKPVIEGLVRRGDQDRS